MALPIRFDLPSVPISLREPAAAPPAAGQSGFRESLDRARVPDPVSPPVSSTPVAPAPAPSPASSASPPKEGSGESRPRRSDSGEGSPSDQSATPPERTPATEVVDDSSAGDGAEPLPEEAQDDVTISPESAAAAESLTATISATVAADPAVASAAGAATPQTPEPSGKVATATGKPLTNATDLAVDAEKISPGHRAAVRSTRSAANAATGSNPGANHSKTTQPAGTEPAALRSGEEAKRVSQVTTQVAAASAEAAPEEATSQQLVLNSRPTDTAGLPGESAAEPAAELAAGPALLEANSEAAGVKVGTAGSDSSKLPEAGEPVIHSAEATGQQPDRIEGEQAPRDSRAAGPSTDAARATVGAKRSPATRTASTTTVGPALDSTAPGSSGTGTDELVAAGPRTDQPSPAQVQTVPPVAADSTRSTAGPADAASSSAATNAPAPLGWIGRAAGESNGSANGGVPAPGSVPGAHGWREADRVRLVQRVARAFEVALDRGSPLRLRLSPPELGSVRIEIQIHDGKMHARLEAETPVAQAALLDNAGALRERLGEHQIRLERFEVDVMDHSRQGLSDRQDRSATDWTRDDPEGGTGGRGRRRQGALASAPEPAPAPRRGGGATNLDVVI